MPDPIRRLQLAFTLHMAHQILGSDMEVTTSESAWFSRRFPREMLLELGFADAAGTLTPEWEEARDEALFVLPTQLEEGDKLLVMEDLVGAAAADGLLCAEESDALAHAAKILGVSDAAWADLLERLLDDGVVRRDGCAD